MRTCLIMAWSVSVLGLPQASCSEDSGEYLGPKFANAEGVPSLTISFNESAILSMHLDVWQQPCSQEPSRAWALTACLIKDGIRTGEKDLAAFFHKELGVEASHCLLEAELGDGTPARALNELPLEWELPDGERIEVRSPLARYLDVLLPLEAEYRKEEWAKELDLIRANTAAALEKIGVDAQLLARILIERYGCRQSDIVVFLCSRPPGPDGITFAMLDGGVVCIVSTAADTICHQVELIVHEVLHAIALSGGCQEMDGFEAALIDGGLEPNSRRISDYLHMRHSVIASLVASELCQEDCGSFFLEKLIGMEDMGEEGKVYAEHLRWVYAQCKDQIVNHGDSAKLAALLARRAIESRQDEGKESR